jgi:hypothetical protein
MVDFSLALLSGLSSPAALLVFFAPSSQQWRFGQMMKNYPVVQ